MQEKIKLVSFSINRSGIFNRILEQPLMAIQRDFKRSKLTINHHKQQLVADQVVKTFFDYNQQ